MLPSVEGEEGDLINTTSCALGSEATSSETCLPNACVDGERAAWIQVIGLCVLVFAFPFEAYCVFEDGGREGQEC